MTLKGKREKPGSVWWSQPPCRRRNRWTFQAPRWESPRTFPEAPATAAEQRPPLHPSADYSWAASSRACSTETCPSNPVGFFPSDSWILYRTSYLFQFQNLLRVFDLYEFKNFLAKRNCQKIINRNYVGDFYPKKRWKYVKKNLLLESKIISNTNCRLQIYFTYTWDIYNEFGVGVGGGGA